MDKLFHVLGQATAKQRSPRDEWVCRTEQVATSDDRETYIRNSFHTCKCTVLECYTGLSVFHVPCIDVFSDFKHVGSFSLCRKPDRVTLYKRTQLIAQSVRLFTRLSAHIFRTCWTVVRFYVLFSFFSCLWLPRLANTIFWNWMHWFWCKFAQGVHGAGH